MNVHTQARRLQEGSMSTGKQLSQITFWIAAWAAEYAVDVLNTEQPGPENGGLNTQTPINQAYVSGMLHVVNRIC
jgi:hypothetical protein